MMLKRSYKRKVRINETDIKFLRAGEIVLWVGSIVNSIYAVSSILDSANDIHLTPPPAAVRVKRIIFSCNHLLCRTVF